MTNFISIVNFGGGMASYHVTAGNNSYTAYLMQSTSSTALPEEITIEKELTRKHNTAVVSPLVKKLVTAIKIAEANADEVN
ncbi:MAG: hypothetical protein ICV66_00010 [Chitinophagaceae bacterium]|nr:hypothetical protein [Chitinophagaceae bacterium]